MGLTLAQANDLIAGVLAEARARDLPPVGVAVLDPGGHLKALQCEDGLSFLRVRICQAKAWGALAMDAGSRRLADRYAESPTQQGFIDALNAMTGGGVIPLPGGVLVRDAERGVLGAVGVAGAASDDDEACAVEAIERLGLSPDRGA